MNLTLLVLIQCSNRHKLDPMPRARKGQQHLGFDFEVCGRNRERIQNGQADEPEAAL